MLNKFEIRTCIIVIVALFAFVLTRVLHITISSIYDPSYYLISHTMFELFSIFVSYSIFFHGWLTFQHTHSSQKLNLSLIFFAVGSIDLLHTLSYKGMPFFQSDNTLQVATWFWITGRLIESIGMGYYIVKQKDEEITEKWKNTKIGITILLVLLLIFSILKYEGHFPVLVKEGAGVTNTKIIIEYIISMIHFTTLVIIFRQYLLNRNRNDLTTFTGIIFILIAELVFTLYRNVYDIDNLLGHIFKVLGYFYLFRGIFFPQFRAIFEDKEKAELERQFAEEKLKEQESKVTSSILLAQEEERMRVSQHLHDGVGQSLYNILASLKVLKQLGVDDRIVHQLKHLEELTSQSMDEVKSIAFQLRPNSLDNLGLFSAIRIHIQRYESKFGIRVELEFSGKKQRYSPEIETELYRIFQEALNNAAKYAETEKIIVRIINNINSVELQIIDEGKGFNIHEYNDSKWQKGIGLYSMKERASLLKGTLEIESIENVGTKIKVVIPI
ncbi:signal transduction histidine kinase [Schinkia azotoformans MEV2011]|uniref:histidine kinase n=1 Tax=Schinkia azotoformans MEV2011 TaxID=1348973 RepID=A0A072NRB6_SCHAZ|nr:MASE3 domain-containing protein [Schinkia azotoformans]KEF39777.1 signal transduction histidine kinase [Schinkia azotoformans MEV2011]MEC1695003.1 MASE3 domain-containing protein [Schinkia azotoformans]MEC1726809.1 MASE3 domain-containing protein [Schinkia azotoformans]MEC1781936.1 MASE3 domain-containing protein [Schinkia azotoformans]MED4328805.1 MASE3 domain-containing protein [Schinkia azotoformans]